MGSTGLSARIALLFFACGTLASASGQFEYRAPSAQDASAEAQQDRVRLRRARLEKRHAVLQAVKEAARLPRAELRLAGGPDAPLTASSELVSLLEPDSSFFTGDACPCFPLSLQGQVGEVNQRVDVLLAIDLTGSMGEERDELVSNMQEIIDELEAFIPDVAFGLASYRDYAIQGFGRRSCSYFMVYGDTGDWPYELEQSITSDRSVIRSAVRDLPRAGAGGDPPESYARMLHEAVHDTAIAWRDGARRIVVNFGDELPHDCEPSACIGPSGASLGMDPGRDGDIGGSDDLPMDRVLTDMENARIVLLHLESSGGQSWGSHSYLEHWTCWAERTNGTAESLNEDGTVPAGLDLSELIAELVETTALDCPTLEITAEAGYEGWLSDSGDVHRDVPVGESRDFEVVLCVPDGTPPGLHSFELELRCGAETLATSVVEVDLGVGCGDCLDVEPPVLVPGTLASCYESAAEAEAAALAATVASDDSAEPPELVAATSGDCDALIVVTATDGCGNSAAVEYHTTIDPDAPVLHGVPADDDVDCHEVPAPASPTAIDDCDPNPRVAFAETRIDGSCPDEYRIERQWTATDRCGNARAELQVLNIRDTSPPTILGVPADAIAECDAVPAPAVPSIADECDPDPSLDFLETRIDGPCVDTYTLERLWTGNDRCGNVSSELQVVSVQDTTPPVPMAALRPALPRSPRSPTSVCSPPSSRAFIVEGSASDACDPSPTLEARMVVTQHDVLAPDLDCRERIDLIPVELGELIEIRLVAPPCPAAAPLSPRSPRVSMSVNSLGVKVFTGESVVLELVATDRCGNAASSFHDPTLEPSALCDEVLLDGTCCPALAAPAPPAAGEAPLSTR